MININIVGNQESKFFWNKNIDFTKEVRSNVSIGFSPRLFIGQDDIPVFSIEVIYTHEKDVLLRYRVSLFFHVDNWKELVKTRTDQEIISNQSVKEMAEVTIGFLRGALAIQTQETPLERAILPIVDLDEMVKHIKVERK